MKIICISDTHLRHSVEVPDGDLLIHAGDGTVRGTAQEVDTFAQWFGGLPHAHKVCIPGNHDFLAQDNEVEYRAILARHNVDHALIHEVCTVEGLKVFGSPWTPWFHDWAFNMPQNNSAVAKSLWQVIPQDADIVVTHGPPKGILDRTKGGLQVGCPSLAARLAEVGPKLHVCGHIHEAYGVLNADKTTYVNASILNLAYEVANAPQVLDIEGADRV